MQHYSNTTTDKSAMLAQMQVVSMVPLLSVLLEHPEFQQGLATARECFLECYEAAPLTEEEMIAEVESELSYCAIETDREIFHLLGKQPLSYLYHLGFVFGTINEGLTYASTPC